MLQIRAKQLEVFRQTRMREFEKRMADHVIGQYPQESALLNGRAGVLALIRRTIAHGFSLGFSTERDLAALIDLTVVYGERFEDSVPDSEIREVLHDREISPSSRVELVLELMPE